MTHLKLSEDKMVAHLMRLRNSQIPNEELQLILQSIAECDELSETDMGQDEHIKFVRNLIEFFTKGLAMSDAEIIKNYEK